MGPKLHEKIPLGVVEKTEEQDQTGVIYQELSNEASDTAADKNAKIELYPGTGEFIATKVNPASEKASAKGSYSLNFDDADLGEVSKVVLSDILGANYVLSPKVTGTVTLQTTRPLSKAELLPTLEMLLEINNAVLLRQNGVFQIKPRAEAVAGSAFSAYSKHKQKQKLPAGHQIKVVPVRNVAVGELAEIIKPLLEQKTILHVDENRNMMLIAGSGAELARTMEMVNTFDVDVMKGRSFGLFPLQNVAPGTIIEELEQVFNQKSGEAGFFQFIEIERLNSILAITHQPKYLNKIERWILRLDKANTSAGGGVVVYRVQHADAVKLAETLNDIFSQSGQSRRLPSVASGKKTVQITNKEKKTKTAETTKKTNITSVGDVGEVKIIADEPNNALIIVATAQDYAIVHNVIKQLDVMPLQVLIDATIVEVTLEDGLKYGIKWFIGHKDLGGEGAASSGGLGAAFTDVATRAAIAAGTGGFGYAFISDSNDVKAVLNAAATDNNLNVIASPSLMVLNHEEANIRVGDEVPILTSESTNTSGGNDNVVTNTIEQRETGVKLTVKPRVNANGLVIMDIEQSVENVVTGLITGSGSTIDSPTISTREINSSVAVQSGETIVLGGLIQEQDTFNKGGIPILHELPWIGPLFGTTEKKKKKTELVVLITPRVISTRKDARLITREFKRKLSGIYEEEAVSLNEDEEEIGVSFTQ